MINKIFTVFLALLISCSIFLEQVKAKPITEPTQENQFLLNKYYQNYIDKEGYKLGLYLDIEPTDELYSKILIFKNLGLFTKREKYFSPKKAVTAKEFIESYLFVFNNKNLNLKIEDYYKLSEQEQLDYLKKQSKNFTSSSFSKILQGIELKTIDYSEALSAIQILDKPLRQKKNLSRQDMVNNFYLKLKKEKLLEKIEQKTFGYEYPSFDKNKLPEIKLDQRSINVNGKELRGLFINWMDINNIKHETIQLNEIERMKKLNIIGVSLEVGWNDIEKEQGKFVFPAYFDQTLNLLAKHGLYVHLLLSPHYTPNWVFKKYSQEIRMVDINGNFQEEGEYATFSYESPAVEDQIRFQKAATKYYANFPNIVTILLGNEQSYGRMHDLDYSTWVEKAWIKWLKSLNLPTAELPKEQNSEAFLLFKRFRQVSLNNYFNRVYDAVKPVQTRVPLSFKFIPYENTSAFSPKYGLHLSPLEIKSDFLAIDIYGHTSNVYGLINSFNLPKVIIETNLPGDWSANLMTKYLLINYLRGIPLQSIFAWFKSTYENSLLLPDGTYWQKTYALSSFSKIIRAIERPNPREAETAIVIPTYGLNMEGNFYLKYQYPIDNLIDHIYRKKGIFPAILWSDDIFSNQTNSKEQSWEKEYLEKFKEIIIFPSPYEKSKKMKNDINTIIYFSPEEYLRIHP